MIKSVQKATTLLTILADHYGTPISLAELALRANINKSTCAHLIATLEEEGFAVKISHSKGYILGPAAYCLSRFGRYKSDIVAVCRPVLQFLSRSLQQTVLLSIIEGNTKYIVDCVDNGNIFESKARIRADDIYRTATGRAILTNLPQEQIQQIFEKYGVPDEKLWPEMRSLEDLLLFAAQNRKKAVIRATTHSAAAQMAFIGYGAAIFNPVGCAGAIGIAVKVPLTEEARFYEKEEEHIRVLLHRGAREATRRLLTAKKAEPAL